MSLNVTECIKSLTGIILLLCAFQVNAVVLKIATLSPEGTSWMNEMRDAASLIVKQTQGRVVLKFYPGGVMGSDSNVLRKIRIGQLQGGAVTAGSLTEIYPDIDIYGLPYMFDSLEQVDYVREKMDALLMTGLEENEFVSFGLAEGGFSYMMSEQPLHTAADVRNQKVWIPSGSAVGEAVFNSAEVSPVNLPLSDVLTGLQTGLVNTVIASPIGAIALQWHTKIRYLIDMPLTYFSALMVVDKKAFNKLEENDQAVVRSIMSDAFARINRQNRENNLAAREALRNQDVEFISLSKETIAEWRSIGDKALRQLEQQNSYTDRVYKLFINHVEAAKTIRAN